MAIVLLSVTGIILEEMKSGVIPINPTIIRVMRVLRIARGASRGPAAAAAAEFIIRIISSPSPREGLKVLRWVWLSVCRSVCLHISETKGKTSPVFCMLSVVVI